MIEIPGAKIRENFGKSKRPRPGSVWCVCVCGIIYIRCRVFAIYLFKTTLGTLCKLLILLPGDRLQKLSSLGIGSKWHNSKAPLQIYDRVGLLPMPQNGCVLYKSTLEKFSGAQRFRISDRQADGACSVPGVHVLIINKISKCWIESWKERHVHTIYTLYKLLTDMSNEI